MADRVDPRVPCPICGEPSEATFVAAKLPIRICGSCRGRFVWPQPSAEELRGIYSDAYFEGTHEGLGFEDYGALEPGLRLMFRRHLRRIGHYVPAGRLVDVGCAFGFFLGEAIEDGWQAAGVEISPTAAAAAAARVPVHAGTLESAMPLLEPGGWDAVTFWDTLEHVPDPKGDLRRANRLLRPGGCLFLTMPKAWGILPRAMGRHWFGYKKAGEHLFFFSKEAIERLLDAAGFRPLVVGRASWTCTVGFLASKIGYYSPALGREAVRAARAMRIADRPVDFPFINVFVGARKEREVS